MKKCLCILGIVFVLTSLSITEVLADGAVAYRIFNKASNLEFKEPVSIIIRSQAKWKSFYRSGTASNNPALKAPKIDFGIYNAVIVATGEKPHSGFATAIVNVYDDGGSVLVSELDVEYCSSIGAQVFTYPSVVILVPKTKKPFQFDVSSATVACK